MVDLTQVQHEVPGTARMERRMRANSKPEEKLKMFAGSRPRRYHPLVVVCLAFCAGIVLDRSVHDWVELGWRWSLPALLTWLACYWSNAYRVAFCALMVAIISLGADWHANYWDGYRATEIGRMVSTSYQPLCLQGTARAHAMPLPLKSSANSKTRQAPRFLLQLDVRKIRDGRHWRTTWHGVFCAAFPGALVAVAFRRVPH